MFFGITIIMVEKFEELAGKFPFGMKELSTYFDCDEKIAIIYTMLKEENMYPSKIKEKSGVGEKFDTYFKEISNDGVIGLTGGGLNMMPDEESQYSVKPIYKKLIGEFVTTAPGKNKDKYSELLELFK